MTATNNAGGTNTGSFTVTPDTTNPINGALTVNGTTASGGGATSYNSTGSFTISAITDYTDAGSGLAASTLVRDQAPLSSTDGIANGTCGSFGSATTISSRATPIAQTLTGPTCYRYTLTGTDNVGNTVSISTTVKVDTTGPSAPTPTLSAATGNTYINGTTVYTNPQAGKSGGFTVTSAPTDSDSGILNVIFPALTGFSSGGGTDTSSPYSTTYAWSGAAATASGSKTVTATNNATGTTNSSFTVTPDTTNPINGAVSVNGTAATGGGSTSTTSSTSFSIDSRTDYTDAGSGLASSTLTIQSETLTGSTCGSPGSGGAVHVTDHDQRHHQPRHHRRLLLPLHPHRHRQRRQHPHLGNRHRHCQQHHDGAGDDGGNLHANRPGERVSDRCHVRHERCRRRRRNSRRCRWSRRHRHRDDRRSSEQRDPIHGDRRRWRRRRYYHERRCRGQLR